MTDKKDTDEAEQSGDQSDAAIGPEDTNDENDAAPSVLGRVVLIGILVLAVVAGSLLVWRQIDRPSFDSAVEGQFAALTDSLSSSIQDPSPANQQKSAAPENEPANIEPANIEPVSIESANIEPETDDSAEILAERVGRLGDQQVAMTQAVDHLTAVLERLEGRISSLEDASEDFARLAEQSGVSEQQETAAETAAQDQLSRLEQRLAEVEARAELVGLGNQNRKIAEQQQTTGLAGLALVQLRRAADQGRPFKAELENLSRLLTAEDVAAAPLGDLKMLAGAGVPTLAILSGDLSRMAPAIVRAGETAPTREPADVAAESWWDGVTSRFAGLVTVRRIGDVAGDDPEALVARAEVSMEQGDLAGAVELLSQIEGGDAGATSPSGKLARWLADARRRLALDQALLAMEAALAADWAEKQFVPEARPESKPELEPQPDSVDAPVLEGDR